jgi:putative Holliday junction resolvase
VLRAADADPAVFASPLQSGALKSETVLAFDFGEKRIGVAMGETALRIAHPLEAIDAAENAVRFERIGALIDEWKPARLVVGLPLSLDGAEHRLTALARGFARRLEGRFGLPVQMVDERLTSAGAQWAAREAGLDARAARPHLDALAAQQILEAFFDSHES